MNDFDILKLQDDKSLIFRVKTEWKEQSFKITIFLTTSKAYHGHVTEEDLRKLSEAREQNVNHYYNNIKQCLKHPEPDISYDIRQSYDPSCNNVEFLIKRTTGGRIILFFSASLCEVNFLENVFNIIDNLDEKHRKLHKRLADISEQQTEVQKEKKALQEKLAEFVELKSNWEQEMYSNFLIVLNEKKKRIAFLTDLLKQKSINPNEINELNERMEETTTTPSRLETISDSSSEYNTDRESSGASCDEDIEREPTPSTSKQNIQMDEDPTPLLCLPKLSKKPKEKQLTQKVKLTQDSTCEILTANTQPTPQMGTQEPYLSTQEMLDRY